MSKNFSIVLSTVFLISAFSCIGQTNDKPVLAKYSVSNSKKNTATHSNELKRYAKTDDINEQHRIDSLQKANPPQLKRSNSFSGNNKPNN